MSTLAKWLYSTIILIIICLIIVGCKSNNIELPKEEDNPSPNEFDTPNSESGNNQKDRDSDIISEEDPFPDKETKLPKNTIHKRSEGTSLNSSNFLILYTFF